MVAFRDFVDGCVEKGLAKIVTDHVRYHQIPALTADEERRGNRALLFQNVTDCQARIVSNLFGSAKRLCQALSIRNLSQIADRLDNAMAKPSELRIGEPLPSGYDVIKNPDLAEVLPLITYSQEDATPYLTSGIVLVRDPLSNGHHLCYVRMAILGGSKLIFNAATPRIKKIVELTVGQNQPLEVTILIGPPVELLLTAGMSLPHGVDKLNAAAAMSGNDVRFCGSHAMYPLPSEFALRGRVIPEYMPEGPFGDLKGLYSFKSQNPICVIEEVIRRKNPLFHSISAGTSREHFWLVTMGVRYLLEKLRRRFPHFVRYSLPLFGFGRVALMTMRPDFNRDELVKELWNIPITRMFVLVNADVNLRSATDILWAIIQRAKDVENFMFSDRKHPVFQERKLAVDATVSDLTQWDNRRISVYSPKQ
jgi:2,5-furandicarboxylate decarboxylase 1